MKRAIRNQLVATLLLTEALVFGSVGIAIGHADDAPGAGMIGILLLLTFAFAAYRAVRRSPAQR